MELKTVRVSDATQSVLATSRKLPTGLFTSLIYTYYRAPMVLAKDYHILRVTGVVISEISKYYYQDT